MIELTAIRRERGLKIEDGLESRLYLADSIADRKARAGFFLQVRSGSQVIGTSTGSITAARRVPGSTTT
jgi:hypothetical protein